MSKKWKWYVTWGYNSGLITTSSEDFGKFFDGGAHRKSRVHRFDDLANK